MQNGKKDRLDRIEELLQANTKALAHTRETLDMAAAQTAENSKQIAVNTKQISAFSKEFRTELAKSRKEHDREMKEIRGLFKQMIRRIAV